MARRRLQQKGNLYEQNGWWKLRWREDVRDSEGNVKRAWSSPVVVGPAAGNPGMNGFTKRQAQREAWERFLSRLDQNNFTPRSVVTFWEFVEKKFYPEHIQFLKPSTRAAYKSLLDKHILPVLGKSRIRDIGREDIQKIVTDLLQSGKAIQTAYHVRNTISAVFNVAEDLEWNSGNPAKRVRLPELQWKSREALTWTQVVAIANVLKEPYRSMVIVLSHTGLRIGELCGLKWKWVNLSDSFITVGKETIAPYTIAVRENFTHGSWGTLKTRSSRRNIPMTATVWVELAERRERAGEVLPDSVVFANTKGGPMDAHNMANRHFRDAVKAAGVPRATLHCLRYTAATFADQSGMSMADRMKMLGHTGAATTIGYTTSDLARVREKLDLVEQTILSTERTSNLVN